MSLAIIKKSVLIAASAGTFILAPAQKSDAKSRQILDAVSANYKANKNSYFKFVYGSGSGKVTKTEPGIFYSTPTQYKLKIMGTEQIFDGSRVYNISAEDREVTVARPNGTEQMLSPTNYLSSYKKDFNAAYMGKITVNGVQADLVRLTPVGKNGLKHVNLYINTPKKQIIKIEQFSINNDVATIAVKEYRANQSLAPDMFSFNKNNYKDYVITEL